MRRPGNVFVLLLSDTALQCSAKKLALSDGTVGWGERYKCLMMVVADELLAGHTLWKT
jgi:hypothetical protein